MEEDMKLKSTPIQRNEYDVAIELTNLYFSYRTDSPEVEEIQQVYARFYAVVCGMDVKFRNGIPVNRIEELLPEALKEK